MKIYPEGPKLFHSDGQTVRPIDKHNEDNSKLGNFAKTPKNVPKIATPIFLPHKMYRKKTKIHRYNYYRISCCPRAEKISHTAGTGLL
jgi:hypothetical protein